MLSGWGLPSAPSPASVLQVSYRRNQSTLGPATLDWMGHSARSSPLISPASAVCCRALSLMYSYLRNSRGVPRRKTNVYPKPAVVDLIMSPKDSLKFQPPVADVINSRISGWDHPGSRVGCNSDVGVLVRERRGGSDPDPGEAVWRDPGKGAASVTVTQSKKELKRRALRTFFLLFFVVAVFF